MVRIEQNKGVQKFGLTCTERGTLINPYYLFVFTHSMTNTIKKVVLTDTSTRKERYNLFDINDTFFDFPGWYGFDVYEQTDEANLDESKSGSIVENGRLFVATESAIFKETYLQTNFIEYGE